VTPVEVLAEILLHPPQGGLLGPLVDVLG